ncbi:MAG TPA: flagellar motor switch protein FliM [Pirellulales bacterium]|nr:flagellar motor switch protein FliM [Pirellulales bacterium]
MTDVNSVRRETRPLLNPTQVAGLYGLHKSLGRDFSAALTDLLRSRVDVKSPTLDQVAYASFLAKIDQPACIAIVRLAPLDAEAAVHVSPSLLYPMLDRLLGGRDTNVAVDRSFTEIELRLVRKIFDAMLRQWCAVLLPAVAVEPTILGIENDPGLAQIASTYEPVVRLRLEAAIGASRGAVQMCIPCAALAKHIESFAPTDRELAAASPLGDTPSVDVVVTIAETRLPASQLSALQLGDVIVTDTAAYTPATIEIDQLRRLRGRVGRIDGHRAVRIEKV